MEYGLGFGFGLRLGLRLEGVSSTSALPLLASAGCCSRYRSASSAATRVAPSKLRGRRRWEVGGGVVGTGRGRSWELGAVCGLRDRRWCGVGRMPGEGGAYCGAEPCHARGGRAEAGVGMRAWGRT